MMSLTSRLSRTMRESWTLAHKLLAKNFPKFRTPRQEQQPLLLLQDQGDNWRVACLELYQNEDNEMARKLLQLDKEFHLLRYHGFQRYFWKHQVQQQQQQQQQQHYLESGSKSNGWFLGLVQPYFSKATFSTTTTTTTTNNNDSNETNVSIRFSTTTRDNNSTNNTNNNNSNTNSTTNTSTATVARIPFVITRTMRQELVELLGYHQGQIRKLTPLHASLLLQHQVSANEMEEQLPVLIQQHEEKEREQEETMLQRQPPPPPPQDEEEQQQLQQPEDNSHNKNSDDEEKESTTTAEIPIPPPLEQLEKVNDEHYQVPAPAPTPSATERIVWYRVVEAVDYNGKSIHVPVGLHRTLEQAQQDCELRQELADRNYQSYSRAAKRHFKIISPPPSPPEAPTDP